MRRHDDLQDAAAMVPSDWPTRDQLTGPAFGIATSREQLLQKWNAVPERISNAMPTSGLMRSPTIGTKRTSISPPLLARDRYDPRVR